MIRRKFITLLGSAAAVWPLAARAQSVSMRRVIVLMGTADDAEAKDRAVALQEGLQKLRWTVGRDLQINYLFAAGSAERLLAYANEAVASKPDILLAQTNPAVKALQNVTRTLPIVFLQVSDPVGAGFVRSLSHPGGNITGVAFDASPEITAKQAQLLIEVVPKMTRMAVLWNPTSAFLRSYWDVLKASGSALGVKLQSLEVRDANEFEATFDAMTREHADGLIVLSDTFTTFYRARLAELAARHKLPAIYGHDEYIEAGGLMSYGPSLSEGYRLAADFVDKVLKGAKPADLPVAQPTKFELIINLETAKALDLNIPAAVLSRADKVV